MLRLRRSPRGRQRGAALVEILVSLVIVAFGLVALAGLQTRMNAATLEAYQRAQALTLLEDMTQRLQANINEADDYVVAQPLGTADAEPADCSGLGAATRARMDQCEWSNALKGAAELRAGDAAGAMIGARGCVDQLQAANPATGVCQPAAYRVTVTWQGFNATVAPALACASGAYGDNDALRKAVSSTVIVPLPACS